MSTHNICFYREKMKNISIFLTKSMLSGAVFE